MDLTPSRAERLQRLRMAIAAVAIDRIVYRTEWLGYLPYGLYHWIEADGRDVSLDLPPGWGRDDLEALESVGFLSRIDAWENPDDPCETRIIWEVVPG